MVEGNNTYTHAQAHTHTHTHTHIYIYTHTSSMFLTMIKTFKFTLSGACEDKITVI